MSDYKLSLPAAIFINVNIMMGAGVFINTTLLAQYAGILGGFCYIIIGLLTLPLITSIAQLMRLHPSGGFYAFAQKELGTHFGFMSAWSYFIGKLASATLMIHTSLTLLQQLLPALQSISILLLDICVLAFFVTLNRFNIRTGSKIQYVFIAGKFIPILSVIIIGSWFYNGSYITAEHMIWSGIPLVLPFVLYATMGFEATCSLSSNIKNARVNGPRAIFISYAIVICIAFLYQTLFYLSIGDHLLHASSYLNALPALMQTIFSDATAKTVYTILHICIASSALGGAYGILYSNAWNLHILAEKKHTFFAATLSRLNPHAIPMACVFIEGLFCVVYLITTYGHQTTLQQLGSLGTVCAYTFSVLSLLAACVRKADISTSIWIPILGLLNCAILIGSCIRGLLLVGTLGLGIFALIVIAGISMFLVTKRTA